MLTKNERALFKLAKRSEAKSVDYLVAKEKLGLSFDDVTSAAYSLIGRNLAFEKSRYRDYAGVVPCGIVLTEKGRHRFRFALGRFTSFMVRSIFVPCIVAFITTLITVWLTSLFSL